MIKANKRDFWISWSISWHCHPWLAAFTHPWLATFTHPWLAAFTLLAYVIMCIPWYSEIRGHQIGHLTKEDYHRLHLLWQISKLQISYLFLVWKFTGRTLDFAVDLSNTSIIGRKFLNQELHGSHITSDAANTPSNQSSLSRKGSGNESDPCWKKPQNSQVTDKDIRIFVILCWTCLPIYWFSTSPYQQRWLDT